MTLTGDDDATITLRPAIFGHHRHRQDDLTVTNLADSTNTITTGHNDTSVTDTDGGDAVLVAAASLDDGSKLTLSGAAAFTVTGLIGDLDAVR